MVRGVMVTARGAVGREEIFVSVDHPQGRRYKAVKGSVAVFVAMAQ